MERLLELVDAGAREVRFVVREGCVAQEALRSVGLSRPGVARAFARGSVLRDGRALAAGTRLRAGEKISLALVRTREARHGRPRGVAAGGGVDVVYEDRFVVAVDKPAGLLVHSDGRDVETLTDRVQTWADERGYDCAVQALQRLDVETTGVTLFSLTEEFQPAFDELVAGHGMRKRYLLEVAAGFPEGERWIEAPIGRDRHDARRMRVSRTGKPSRTLVRKLGERGGRALLLAELATGRRHQIRVHLASMGFPLA
ncbi:MAG: RluA family pseudouridine synthase, partial [Olsenella sp.]|nr:RluA family pseudouridine synthase [Olsenella sp.]